MVFRTSSLRNAPGKVGGHSFLDGRERQMALPGFDLHVLEQAVQLGIHSLSSALSP